MNTNAKDHHCHYGEDQDVKKSSGVRSFGGMLSPFQGSLNKPSSTLHLLYNGFLLGLFFDPEDGGKIFLQNFS
jgi:hypothetical protein